MSVNPITGMGNGFLQLISRANETSLRMRMERVREEIHALGGNAKFKVEGGTIFSCRDSIGFSLNDLSKGITVRCTDSRDHKTMIAFFKYLAHNTTITSFIMDDGGLGGMNGDLCGTDDAIVECVKENYTLQSLNVVYCHIGEEGVFKIVDALAENKGLTYLNVRGNGISNDVVRRLISILNYNSTLMCITLSQNNFPDEKALNRRYIVQADQKLLSNIAQNILKIAQEVLIAQKSKAAVARVENEAAAQEVEVEQEIEREIRALDVTYEYNVATYEHPRVRPFLAEDDLHFSQSRRANVRPPLFDDEVSRLVYESNLRQAEALDILDSPFFQMQNAIWRLTRRE